MGNYQARFWRAVEGVTPSLTLILRLTATQQATIDQWLELARRQYNYRLAERFNWYEQNRCDVLELS